MPYFNVLPSTSAKNETQIARVIGSLKKPTFDILAQNQDLVPGCACWAGSGHGPAALARIQTLGLLHIQTDTKRNRPKLVPKFQRRINKARDRGGRPRVSLPCCGLAGLGVGTDGAGRIPMDERISCWLATHLSDLFIVVMLGDEIERIPRPLLWERALLVSIRMEIRGREPRHSPARHVSLGGGEARRL